MCSVCIMSFSCSWCVFCVVEVRWCLNMGGTGAETSPVVDAFGLDV
jgi:hypothetical protein